MKPPPLLRALVMGFLDTRFADWALMDLPVVRLQLVCVLALVFLNAWLAGWGDLLGIIPVCVPLIVLLFKGSPSPYRVEKGSPSTSAVDHNTAVHEAGHALVAFYSGAEIMRAHITRDREGALGAVEYNLNAGPEGLYGRLAVAQGGIAAEALLFGKWSSGGARTDLLHAHETALEIRNRLIFTWWGDRRDYVPPKAWANLDTIDVRFDFTDVFRTPLMPQERLLLELGYRRAKTLIIEHRVEFDRLVAALLEHRSLTGSEVRRLLEQAQQAKIRP